MTSAGLIAFPRPDSANASARPQQRGRSGVVYTPQVILDGTDLAGWGNAGRFASNVANVNKSRAAADIRLTTALAETTLRLDGEVRVEESCGALLSVHG